MQTCRDKGSGTFLLPLSFLPSGGEPITSETRLLSRGPLVHPILTRWTASDNGRVEERNEFAFIGGGEALPLQLVNGRRIGACAAD